MRAIKAAQRGAFGIQKFLSDYLLGGIDKGLTVGSVQRFESLEVMGSLISEDINCPPIEWTRELVAMKAIMEEHGLIIIKRVNR